jgi:ATP-dependent helicase/nuclease subunit A
VQEVVDRDFNKAETSDYIKELIRYFGSRYKLEDEIKKLLNNRKNVLIIKQNIYSQNQIQKFFDDSFLKLTKAVNDIYSNRLLNLIKEINNTVLAHNKSNQIANEINLLIDNYEQSGDLISFLHSINEKTFTKSGTVRKQNYLSNQARDEHNQVVQQLESLFKELKPLTDISTDPDLHKKLSDYGRNILHLFDQVLEVYEQKKKSNSYIDFEDILIHTKALLKNIEIKKQLSEKFKYVMVDEYQDTDETQYEIFLPLLDDLQSGNLFIVGDEKQSIYRFRDADLNVFEKTKSDILQKNNQDGIQILPDTFRMVKELCLFTNCIFNKIFDTHIPLFNELKNTPLICANLTPEKGEIEFLITDVEQPDCQTQPELVALKILDIIDEGKYKFSDFAILVTKRKHFEELENIFTLRNIPYKIVGGRGFYQRQVISDIRNYLAFLSNPNDDIALIAILRSPFFMISDSEIMKISFEVGSTFYGKLKKYYLSQNKLGEIIDKLEANIKLASSIPVATLIRMILSDSYFLIIVKNRHNGEQEIANIEKLMKLAREFDEIGFRNLYDFVKHLDEASKENLDESQAEGLFSETGVKLLTIHQAKGLEFPIVFLYRCESYPDSSSNKARSITVNKDIGLLFKIPPADNPLKEFIVPQIVSINDFIEQKKDLAEIKRLLYVGVTRAINKLFVTFEKNKKNEYRAGAFIKLFEDVLKITQHKNLLLEDELTFLKKENDRFFNTSEKVSVEIKVTSLIETSKTIRVKEEIVKQNFHINTEKLHSEINYQIISATKIVIYHKCPLKYYLTYNIGLAKLLLIIPTFINSQIQSSLIDNLLTQEKTNQEDEISEDYKKLNSPLNFNKLGLIVHKILEKEIPPTELKHYLTEQSDYNFNNVKKQDYIETITKLFETYFRSDVYSEIKQHKNFRNEYEILIKEGNIILKGIIDKIIFGEDSITIIDYKTDLVDDINAADKYADYQLQMKFYLYISMKFFEKVDKFYSKLIFLRNPKICFDLVLNRGDFPKLQDEILGIIHNILENQFSKKTNHCPNCIFYIKNQNCIVK